MEKIKLVIVDDELTSRNTIKKYLEKNEVYEVAADFQNGKSALEWMRKNTIDILLCDMQMPEMNGVELMRNVHIIDKYLPVIAISGFDDFNYVRGSLVNGAANYLLKHELSKEHLIHVLDQVRDQYRIVPKGETVYRKKGYCIYEGTEFTAEKIRNLTKEEKVEFCCQNVVAIAISPDYKIREDLNILEYKQDISKAVVDIIGQILGENYPYIVYVTKEYHLAVLLSFVKEKSRLLMLNTISNIVGRIQRMTIRMLDITVSIVCGEVRDELENAVKEAEDMLEILKDKFYLGENRTIFAAVTKKLVYTEKELPDKYWDQLEFEVKNQIQSCSGTISDMLEEMEKEHYERRNVQKNCERILSVLKNNEVIETDRLNVLTEQMNEYETFGQYQTCIMNVLNIVTQSIRKKDKKQYSANITRTLEYINNNYMNDISLEICAEEVGCSYTSLSREFRKETGMRFVEYLNQQRVNKAKSLLIRKDISMKEIVEVAGFRNYNYFFKVFKEMVGVTPSEFATKK